MTIFSSSFTLKKTTLCTALSLATAMSVHGEVIKDIKFQGNKRFKLDTLIYAMGADTILNQELTADKTQEILKRLYQTGYFKDIRLEQQGSDLVVMVQERVAIKTVEFDGADGDEEILKKAFKEQLQFGEGFTFDESLLIRAEKEIKNYFSSKGFYGVQVEKTITPVNENQVAVKFTVTRGDISSIKSFTITGNKDFSEKELKNQLVLGLPNYMSWYTKNDQYSQEKFQQDLETLRSFYLTKGYIEFDIKNTNVSLSPDQKEVSISVDINEGKPYKVKSVNLTGNTVGQDDELKEVIKLQEGDIFNGDKLGQTIKDMQEVLGNHGYAFAKIIPQPMPNPETSLVDLNLEIEPGREVYIRHINIVGNLKTRDEVIRRQFPQLESAIYNADQIRLSQERVQRMPYFQDVEVSTVPVAGTNNQMDLSVNVRERQTGTLNVGVGVNSTTKLQFNASIQQDNVFGSGQSIGLDINTSRVNKVYSITQTDPFFTESGVSRTFDISVRDLDASALNIGNYRYRFSGGGLKFGIPFGRNSRFFAGLGIEQTDLFLSSDSPKRFLDYEKEFGPRSRAALLNLGWNNDTRNNILTPNKGHFQSFNAEVTLPTLDLRYYRLSYQQQYYYPINKDYTFAFKQEVDYGKSLDDKAYPVFKNYYSGGVGSVRGYFPFSVGPRESNGDYIGGNKRIGFSGEFLFPFPGTNNDRSVRLFTFFDAGNAFAENEKFDVTNLRYSYGFGLNWLSPLGPLKLNFGFPINKKPTDQLQKFQFQIGTGF